MTATLERSPEELASIWSRSRLNRECIIYVHNLEGFINGLRCADKPTPAMTKQAIDHIVQLLTDDIQKVTSEAAH